MIRGRLRFAAELVLAAACGLISAGVLIGVAAVVMRGLDSL